MFLTPKLTALGLSAIALYFAYGWGKQVIDNYSGMAAKIATLERDKRNIESRVASYQTLLARRDAAIAASKCKVQIETWVKNPDTIPTPFDPFNQLGRMK